jgi:GPH family glycoside/pentoside/hexuronide:cation symporter
MNPPTRDETSDATISRTRLLGYAVGSLGTGVFSTVPGLLLLIYMTDVLGVPALYAGLAVMLPKAWDVFLNPVVGAFSDREAVRTGYRTRLMLLGTLALPAAFALMFRAPASPVGGWWVAFAFVIAASAYALFQVPYVALPTEMSDRPEVRTRIATWRIVALTFGLLIGGGLAPMLVNQHADKVAGYASMGLRVAAVMLVCMLAATWTASSVHLRPAADAKPLGLVQSFRLAYGNRPYFNLLAGYVIGQLAVALSLAALAYVATYPLGRAEFTSALFVAIVAPSILVVPLWGWAGNRWGKVAMYQAATLLFAAASAAQYLAVPGGSTTAVLALAVLAGVAFAGQQVLAYAILPDAISADAARSGQQQAGAFTGIWTSMETAVFAIGPGLFSLILAVSGFVSTSAGQAVPQPPSALTGIVLGFSLVPAAIFLLGMPFVARFGRSGASV